MAKLRVLRAFAYCIASASELALAFKYEASAVATADWNAGTFPAKDGLAAAFT